MNPRKRRKNDDAIRAETKRPKKEMDAIVKKEHRVTNDTTAHAESTKNTIHLMDDVFRVVMSMLAPKEMLRLCQCSKSLSQMVNYPDVIRNTILLGSGRYGRKSLKGILALLKQNRIHPPSPLRLLRVVCGQRCELALCQNTVHTIRAQFGIFCCFSCVQNEKWTKSIVSDNKENDNNQDWTRDDRTARYEYGKRKVIVWRKPFIAACGERCGPLITYEQQQQQTKGEETAANTQKEGCRNDADTDLVSKIHFRNSLLPWLLELEKVASSKASAQDELEQQQREDRVLAYRRQKLQTFDATVKKLQEKLDQRWSNIVLKRRFYSSNGWTQYRNWEETKEYNPRFSCPMIQNMKSIRNFIQAPSRVHGSQKKISQMAHDINDVFEIIHRYGFHNFTFLLHSGGIFEEHLYQVMTATSSILERWMLSLAPDDVSILQEHGPLMALAWKVEGEWPSQPPNFFALAVVSYCVSGEKKRATDDALARTLWSLLLLQTKPPSSFRQHCEDLFNVTAQAFTHIRPKVLNFLYHPDSIAFLKENPKGRSDSYQKVKKEELNRVWVNTQVLKRLLHNEEKELNVEELLCEAESKAESRWLGGYW
mmetsp:Transcript_33424/g.50417  ORF Transcript_33424/g.50417 Transcript_33424/m.50417 type:complete len:595 (-) Transcript_33424:234-2018(-)|eukprot:CAMPEP_0178903996 /NCGR_PEP_ID=MMETSP0786-20121207/5461_1 /TAXON_ID=186022 /ORGANISM="Thalassionema frauenfeldii, Strain CCMP 1798" /LENGTH=594 /DNA_ID=CAMNT_0020575417 /DNA_START=121 /DNA_END=1905 /DNA_ORIENTATION=-